MHLKALRQNGGSTAVPVLVPPGGPRAVAPPQPALSFSTTLPEVARLFLSTVGPTLGMGAQFRLQELLTYSAKWLAARFDPALGPLPVFAWSTFRRSYAHLVQQVGHHHLVGAWDGDRLLRAAVDGGDDEVTVVIRWTHRVLRQRGWSRWRVPGKSFEDLLGDVTVELLAKLRLARMGEDPWPTAQVRWPIVITVAELLRRKLQKRRGFAIAHDPADLSQLITTSTPEMLLQDAQHQAALQNFRILFESAPTSKRQLQWMQALRAEAESEKRFSLSDVALALNRSPSAASRMRANFEELLREDVQHLGLLDEE